MKLNPIFQLAEEYFCINCDKFISNTDLNRTGKCAYCESIIQIKLKIKGFYHSCHRVNLNELRVGELITLDLNFIHEILAIEKHSNYYRIALKEYTAINIDNDSIVTRIDGGWYR